MNPSSLFIRRPVATTLLTLAIALAGALAFTVLPVSPLPQVDFPTISVGAGLPGAPLAPGVPPGSVPPPAAHPDLTDLTRAGQPEATAAPQAAAASNRTPIHLMRAIDPSAGYDETTVRTVRKPGASDRSCDSSAKYDAPLAWRKNTLST